MSSPATRKDLPRSTPRTSTTATRSSQRSRMKDTTTLMTSPSRRVGSVSCPTKSCTLEQKQDSSKKPSGRRTWTCRCGESSRTPFSSEPLSVACFSSGPSCRLLCRTWMVWLRKPLSFPSPTSSDRATHHSSISFQTSQSTSRTATNSFSLTLLRTPPRRPKTTGDQTQARTGS